MAPRAIPLLAVWLLLAGNGTLAAADPPAPGLKRARLHVLASESLFSTINHGDAVASMKIWAEQIGRIRGFEFQSKMDIARSPGQMQQGLEEQSVDLLVLDTPDYLSLADIKLVDVVFAGTTRGQLGAFQYLLLTNAASGIGELTGLRGRRIVVTSRTKSHMGLVWLETLLAEDRLGRASGFFSSLDVGNRASSCVLSLFFGKIDACVVDSGNWESMKELNPQLGRLRVVAGSEALVEGVLALPAQPHPYQSELIASILNLHKTAGGEQLGVAFKTGALIRVGKETFDSVRALRSRYRRLVDPTLDSPGSTGGRPGEAAVRGLSK